MLPRPHRIRRGRRTDFVAIVEVLASSDVPTPAPDRATLRRFRHIVADLGNDLYVATTDEHLVGVIHATYARQIGSGPVARVELVVVAPRARRQGVGSSLLRCIESRARKRAGIRLTCDVSGHPELADQATPFFTHLSWSRQGNAFYTTLQP